MKFYIASDHAGFRTKESLKKFLEKKKTEVVDLGAFEQTPSDYPDFALRVAQKVAKDKSSFGLLVCGTGIGMSIAANKVNGIRAANHFDSYTAKAAREHNGANIICLGGRAYKPEKARQILSSFMKAKNPKEQRHKKRISKISSMER